MTQISGSLKVAIRELNAAERHLKNMDVVTTFEDMDREWRGFLVSSEKIWKKAERAGVKTDKNNFPQFQNTFKKIKKSDSVLVYILHARNSDEHTIQEVVSHITNYSATPIALVNRYSDKPDNFININPTMKPAIQMKHKFELICVKDRGVNYYPPHSKNLITGIMSPYEAAQITLAFYKNYIEAIKNKYKT